MEHFTTVATTTTTSSSPLQQPPPPPLPPPPQLQMQRRELQGPRPAPLKVKKGSHKIKKPAGAAPPQQQPAGPPVQVRQPVIIYTVSPKVVHVNPSEFMSVVQRLTGAPPTVASTTTTSSSSFLPPPSFPFRLLGQPVPSPSLPPPVPFQLHREHEAGALELSPAARLAAIERASAAARSGGAAGVLPHLPSILSPIPGSLPPIPPSFFSPAGDAICGDMNLFGELSPAFLGHGALFTGATSISTPPSSTVAPSHGASYYWDLFNQHPHP